MIARNSKKSAIFAQIFRNGFYGSPFLWRKKVLEIRAKMLL